MSAPLRTRARRLAAAAPILVLAVAGCISLSRPSLPVQQYRLAYPPPAAPSGPRLPVVLRVPPMEVAATYDREPIVRRQDDYEIDSYFYARWSSNPGDMVAGLLARDFADSGLYGDVQTAVSLVPPDYTLKGTVEEIEERSVRGGGCSAVLKLRLTLAAARGPRERRVRFSRLYEAAEPVRCGSPEAIAAAMSAALARISAEVQAEVQAEVSDER